MTKVKLPSGRLIDANEGIIGIDAAGRAFEGYDGFLESMGNEASYLTPEERRELADLMIERWNMYKSIADEDQEDANWAKDGVA